MTEPLEIPRKINWSVGAKVTGDILMVCEQFSDIAAEAAVAYANLRDKAIRQALIEAGWTPPPDSETP